MNKLHFIMESNKKEIINEHVAYYTKDEIIVFKINDDIYKYDKKNIILSKKDFEKELVIKFNEKLILIEVNINNIKIDYPISEVNIKTTENKMLLSYKLDSGEQLNNTITIEF